MTAVQHSIDSKKGQIHQNTACYVFVIFKILFALGWERGETHTEYGAWQAVKSCNAIKASNDSVNIATFPLEWFMFLLVSC